jgi:hypothetical protein
MGARTVMRSAAILLAVALLATQPASAEPKDEDVRVLATALVAEAGPRAVDDHPAILRLLRRIAVRVGKTDAQIAVEYCSVFRRPQSAVGRYWRSLSLKALERRAPSVVALVRRWVAGEPIADRCAGTPDHFGNRTTDRERALRFGWREVRCGRSLNSFWRVPR